MTVENAKISDLTEINAIYSNARAFMAKTGNPNQWTDGYPLESDLRGDIDRGELYIMCSDKIEAVFKFITTPDPTYARIDGGAWLREDKYGTLHRVASAGNVPGIFNEIVTWAALRCESLRADTHRDNKVMQNALVRNGFTYCGIIYLENGDERLAYQRI